MKTIHEVLAFGTVFALTAFSCAAAVPRECVRLSFDEGCGSFADDAGASGLTATLAPSAKWARGAFGTALLTGAQGASATLGPVPCLDGTDACSFAIRFRKDGAGFGKYPCLLSTTGWAQGGILFFSDGKALTVRLRSADGVETSVTALAEIPERRWTSLAMTFVRPELKVYVDGRMVASEKWNHAFDLKGLLQVGGWGGNSFGGCVDDFRVYGMALTADEVAAYASETVAAEAEGRMEVVGQELRPIAVLKGTVATLTLDEQGRVSSLRENASGRELVMNVVPFACVDLSDGRSLCPRRMERRGESSYALVFPGKTGEVLFSVTPFGGGWTFAIKKADVPSMRTLAFGCVAPVCNKWKGTFANAWSDERSAVCVRSYGLDGEPSAGYAGLRVVISAPFPAEGLSIGLAAGPRDGFLGQMKEMTRVAGVPQSDCGGAWSCGSEPARRSYVFATVRNGDIDYWIDFVKRGGFSIIHFEEGWADCLGPYPISKRSFPGGLPEMKAAVKKIHDAGLMAGIHSLSGCIGPQAEWLASPLVSDLIADASYTLAAPLSPDSSELVVNERPIPEHVTEFSYSSAGNVLRVGDELIQYSGIRHERPYAFTGLKRGTFGTRKATATAPAGEKVVALHTLYYAFYPVPGSELAERVADRLATIYNTCEMDEFYCDGSEGMGTRYAIDWMRHALYSRLKPNNGHSPIIEASCQNANNWWFQTRTATVDHPVWGMKRFHDWHLDWGIERGRVSDFLEPQMGWWQPRLDVPGARAHFLDEMEYFAAKNAGHDAAMSIQGVTMRPLPIGIRRQLTLLGWYEHARLARCFSAEASARLAQPKIEHRLRQDAQGRWTLTEVESAVHRAGHPWERAWTVTSAERRPAGMRVEALYHAAVSDAGTTILGADDFAALKPRAVRGVSVTLDPAVSADGHGRAFRLSARNEKAPRTGAWAVAKRTFDFPGLDVGWERIAFGAWVKGDGSGALLNLQLTTPSSQGGGISEHYVRLDFTGWKYVTALLRERDASRFSECSWPYGGYAAIYRDFVKPTGIASVAAFLNDIPVGGTASVEIGEIRALKQVAASLEKTAVVLNGKRVEVPFAMRSGEYAELEADGWTHYSANGDKIAVAPAFPLPVLAKGANAVSLDSAADARAEVTLFALGATQPAFVGELTPAMRKELRYEGMMPFEYAPQKGFLPPSTIPVRPGERAALSVEVQGPCDVPTFSFGPPSVRKATTCAFKTPIAADERLICRDGRTWRVEKSKDGTCVKEGTLEQPLPVLEATARFSFTAAVPADGNCTVDILKEYRQ